MCDKPLPVATVVDYIFLISLILTMLAIIGVFVEIPFISSYAFWVAIAAYILLASHRHYVIYRLR
jgi:Sec-independent protein secretion pathway component TatC